MVKKPAGRVDQSDFKEFHGFPNNKNWNPDPLTLENHTENSLLSRD